MTKKIIFSILLLATLSGFSKKVKFAVDMGTYTISPFGIHVMGDFQVAAGYPLDFDPSTIQLTQVGTTSIYTVVVNLPAFQKYEFKFVNGNQGYEVEFVPEKARVGYNFDDNRWLYVDSLANDTTFMGAVLFNGNAPQGQTLIRYLVDMSMAGNVSNNGVHFGSNYNNYSATAQRMYSFGNNIYETYSHVATGTYSFMYFNGNTTLTAESVPAGCAVAGKRTVVLGNDSVLSSVCFSGCSACPVGLKENHIQFSSLNLFPNPSSEAVQIGNIESGSEKISIVSISGKIVEEIKISDLNNRSIEIKLSDYSKGAYQVYVKKGDTYRHAMLIVQ